MRINGMYGTVALMLSLCGPVTAAWSLEMTTIPDVKGSIGREAVVMKIDSDTITLRSLADDNKVFTISRKDAGSLQAGDRVLVDGNSVKKLGTMTDPAMNRGSTDEPAIKSKSVEQQPALPGRPVE